MIADLVKRLLSEAPEEFVPTPTISSDDHVEQPGPDPDEKPFDLWEFCMAETDNSRPLAGIHLLTPCVFLENRHPVGTILHYPHEKAKKLVQMGIACQVNPENRIEKPERITPHLAWDGKQVIVLPRCGDCRHFTRDTINPREGVGDCEAFLLPDGKRQTVRYPMQHPRTEICFEKEGHPR